MNKYNVINITNKLKLKDSQQVFTNTLVDDLKTIRDSTPHIDRIIVRGGAILDSVKDLKQKDIDLFYTYRDKGKLKSGCFCTQISEEISKLDLRLVSKVLPFDLGHFELNEPITDVIDKNCGFFAPFSDYVAMICMDENGEFWSNEAAYYFLENNIYETRPECWLYWQITFSSGELSNVSLAQITAFLRGIKILYYKKFTSIGPDYAELVKNIPVVLKASLHSRDAKVYVEGKMSRLKLTPEIISEVLLDVCPAMERKIVNCFKLL